MVNCGLMTKFIYMSKQTRGTSFKVSYYPGGEQSNYSSIKNPKRKDNGAQQYPKFMRV